MTFKPSPYQQAVYDFIDAGQGSAIVQAVAGSGKSTTIVHALDRIPTTKSTALVAFNKDIVTELKEKVPAHVWTCTMNSLGFGAVRRRLGKFLNVDGKKTRGLMRERLSAPDQHEFGDDLQKIIGLAKSHGIVPAGSPYRGLMPDTDEVWRSLIDRFDIEVPPDHTPYFLTLARELLIAGIQEQRVIDYDDQLYLPVIMRMPMRRFDYLFVDEAQDVSHIQRALLAQSLAPRGRLIAVGDPAQAIYGFRGAASDSLERIAQEFGAKDLPLSISYRCPKSVVMYAQTIVGHIEAADTAPDGEVMCWPTYQGSDFRTDDLVICRNTAPLVSLAYALLAQRVPATVLGRDIGAGLIRLIDKLKPKGIEGDHGLLTKLEQWKNAEIEKLMEQDKEDRIDGVLDRYETILTLVHGSRATTVPKLKAEIEDLFKDRSDRLTLCTVHKSKGMEAQRVFILNPDLMPSRRARQPWQQQQEHNLMYVAYTRAQQTLVFIRDTDLLTQKAQQVQRAVNA